MAPSLTDERRRSGTLTITLSPLEDRAIVSAAERCNLPKSVWARAILMRSLTLNPLENL